jgi:triosephosphate isomerase (TIM)
MQCIIANWKAHKSTSAVTGWFQEFRDRLLELRPKSNAQVNVDRKVVIAPAYFLLPAVAAELELTKEVVFERLGAKLSLGVQDVSHLGAGSYTGAVAAVHLAAMGVTHAIVGHSERRRYFKETSQDVVGKVDQVLDAGITPVVCVDSTYSQEQITMLQRNWLNRLLFAYEPQAAIGSGKNASLSQVKEEVEKIRALAGQVPVLYGGSMNDQNVAEYLLATDGGLVGTASVEGKSFAELLAAAW